MTTPTRQDLATPTLELSGPDRSLVEALAEYVPDAMRVTGTPGLNLALARGDRVIWEAAFGYADLAAASPMATDTVSRAGSIAKIYTATAFMQLVERGALELHDPIHRHLRSPRVVNPLGEREITVYDLLTFRSGLVRDTLEGSLEPIDAARYVEREVHEDRRREYGGTSSRWSARVGERVQYSNFGYAILGQLFSHANPDGITLDRWVTKHILTPLGMSSTALPAVDDERHVPSSIRRRLCTGYARFGPVYVPSPTLSTGSYPGSGLLTTPGDHIRMLLALQHGGTLLGERLVEPETVRLMMTPQRSASETERAFGNTPFFGLGVELANLGAADHHFGRVGSYPWGWWHHSRAYPNLDFAIVVFTNKWDMQGWNNPDARVAGGLIADFAASWLRRAHGEERPVRSWGWRFSYAVGLLMGERLAAFLGIPDALGPDLVAQMAREARVAHGLGDEEPWDEGGFRAGLEDIREVGAHPSALRAFLRSDALEVAPEELPLLWLRLGSQSRSPIPMGFYAAAVEEAEAMGR
jgi:CubicO group peptidase (beta-lactamase class C family)